MNMILWSLIAFLAGYFLNIFYITVLYHRGLAHGSVVLNPWMRKWAVATGSWVTGVDPKAWACMHRLHHRHSDTKEDPHSPSNEGVFGVMLGQLHSYERIMVGLIKKYPEFTEVVKDLNFPVNWVNRKKIWWLPYLVHVMIAFALGTAFHSGLLGAAYWLGIMSHPFQGWLVNAFAHRYGYRNHSTDDQSVNNTWVAWLVMGEGYQNNHHARPDSAQFSERWFEFDGGYWMCLLAAQMRLLKIPKVQMTLETPNHGTHAIVTT